MRACVRACVSYKCIHMYLCTLCALMPIDCSAQVKPLCLLTDVALRIYVLGVHIAHFPSSYVPTLQHLQTASQVYHRDNLQPSLLLMSPLIFLKKKHVYIRMYVCVGWSTLPHTRLA